VYSRHTPSSWQFTDAARKLWGLSSAVNVFDEQGELVSDATPSYSSPAIVELVVERPRPVDERRPPPSPPVTHPTVGAITPEMLADLRRAAHEIRLNLGDWLYGTGDGSEQRAFADRLDAHVRALAAWVRND
jgi:hypothetical protein